MQQSSNKSLVKVIKRYRRLILMGLSGFVGIIVTLIVTEMYDSWAALTPPQILHQLHNPDATLKVTLHIEEGKTTFQQDESVNLFYSVTGTLKGEPFYASLVNISTSGQVSPIFQGKLVCAGYDYSLPTLVNVDCPTPFEPMNRRIRFTHTGQEYFKLIVTSQEITWETIITKYKNNELQLKQPWATAELKIDINQRVEIKVE